MFNITYRFVDVFYRVPIEFEHFCYQNLFDACTGVIIINMYRHMDEHCDMRQNKQLDVVVPCLAHMNVDNRSSAIDFQPKHYSQPSTFIFMVKLS